MENIVLGRNSIIELLKTEREIEKILITEGSEGSIKKIISMAREKKVPLHYSDKKMLDKISNGENHQGVIAYVSEYRYSTIDDLFQNANSKGESPFFVILDGIEDPHNLGAIIRTSECMGVHGIIIPKRNAVNITPTVIKVASGACEYVPCARVGNIVSTIKELQKRGVWIMASDMTGKNYYEQDLTGSVAIVIGSEGKGISRLVKDTCDFTITIPMIGEINSLNASNAASIMLSETLRQRQKSQ